MKKIILSITALVFLGFSQADAQSVRGHIRKDGTYVAPHLRTNPDHNPYNNYNFPGNYNPNIGRTTPGNADNYLDNYYGGDRPSGGFGSSDVFRPYRR
jgi:hypothetical protein